MRGGLWMMRPPICTGRADTAPLATKGSARLERWLRGGGGRTAIGHGLAGAWSPAVRGPLLDDTGRWFDAQEVEPSMKHKVPHDELGLDNSIDRDAGRFDEHGQAKRSVAERVAVMISVSTARSGSRRQS